MSDEASDHPPSLPAAAHRPIRIVHPICHRQATSAQTWTFAAHFIAIGIFVVAIAIAGVMQATSLVAIGGLLTTCLISPLVYRVIREANAVHRELDSLKARGFRVCPTCCYSLEGCEAEGPCPECGEPYDPEYLELTWSIAYWDFDERTPKKSKTDFLTEVNQSRADRARATPSGAGPHG